MTNEYIEVVKRWKAGEVFSVQELMANAEAAADAEDALWDDEDASHATAAAAYAAYRAARAALATIADAYIGAAADDADHWVKRYEELTNAK